MKNISVVLILFSITIIAISCGAGVGDTTKHICGGYTYRTDGGHNYMLSKDLDEMFYSNVFDYNCDSNYILIHQKPHEGFIKLYLSEILSIQYSTIEDTIPTHKIREYYNFKNFDSVLYYKIKGKFAKDNSSETKRFFEKIADSIILHNPKYQKLLNLQDAYWIIDLKSNEEFGPFTLEEYSEMRKKIKIPEELQLQK